MKSIAWQVVMIALLCEGQTQAADPAPQVETKLAMDGDIWQGQRVVIHVTIKTPDTFASAPAFDLPQVSKVILIPPSGRPTLGTEMIGEDSFTTQTHELAVFPQQTGTVLIPPFQIRFNSSVGYGKPVQPRIVKTKAISFVVKQPPGTKGQTMVLTTTELKVSETWKPEPSEAPVAVGSAFTRAIQTTADNLPGIVLPTFQVKPSDGLQVYNRAPTLDDQDNRGDLIGKRTDVATFICERPGQYELPKMTVSWWNPHEQQLHLAELPAHTITVAAPSQAASAEESSSSDDAATGLGPMLLTPLIVCLVVVGGLCWSWPAIRNRWAKHRAAYLKSESHYFRKVVQACHFGEAKATYQAIVAWRQKLESSCRSNSWANPKEFTADEELASELDLLESHLYGPPTARSRTPWSPQKLLKTLTHARSQWMHNNIAAPNRSRLPAINPSSSRDDFTKSI